jgi:hypothetical protein
MKVSLASLVALLALLFVQGCKETAPNTPTQPEPPLSPQPVQTVSLTVVDSASIEAWLKLSMPDTLAERRFRLFLNDSLIWQATLTTSDTLMLVGDYLGSKPFRLSPSTSYRVRLERITTDTFNVNVDEKTFRTLDTTSQDYTWQYLRFGEAGASYFRDVCIINDSCIWAVGRIDTGEFDSLGVPIVYNAVHYDGHQWYYYRLMTATRVLWPQGGGDDSLFSEGWSVVGTSEDDICIAAGAFFEKTQTGWRQSQAEGAGGANRLWKHGKKIYAVGGLGYIAHYNGAVWRRMESGTTARLIDIYGTPDGESVWATGYTDVPTQSCLLSLENGQWRTIWRRGESSMYQYVQALWTSGSSEFVVLGSGGLASFHSRLMPNFLPYVRLQGYVSSGYHQSVRGSARNNIACGGQDGRIAHFNGIRWKRRFDEVYNSDRLVYAIDVSNKLIVAVGRSVEPTLHGAMVLIGRKP